MTRTRGREDPQVGSAVQEAEVLYDLVYDVGDQVGGIGVRVELVDHDSIRMCSGAPLAGPARTQFLHATRSLANNLDLGLPFTVISMSRPSTSKRRIRRSIENPDSLPCFSAETLG